MRLGIQSVVDQGLPQPLEVDWVSLDTNKTDWYAELASCGRSSNRPPPVSRTKLPEHERTHRPGGRSEKVDPFEIFFVERRRVGGGTLPRQGVRGARHGTQ